MKNLTVRDQQTVGGFQQMLFSALSKRGLAGTPFSRVRNPNRAGNCPHMTYQTTWISPEKGEAPVPIALRRLVPIKHAPEDYYPSGECVHPATLGWQGDGHAPGMWRDNGPRYVDAPRSGLTGSKRVLEPTKCTEAGPRGGKCRNWATAGRLTCPSHGSRGRNRGRLVELRPEETPVLLCDR
jgi:hypothetical protein